MKISMISGSQKTNESNSEILLNKLSDILKEKHDIKLFKSGIKLFTNETFKEIISQDVIVLAFPLYGDSIPSHTLKMLAELEKIIKQEKANQLIIYAIINNGFYEGKQNHIAFEVIKHWCDHCGIQFGGGIGQGAGEMLAILRNLPIEKSPFNNLLRSMQSLAKKIELKEPFETVYLSPYFPKFLWKIMGTRFWKNMALKNGIKKKDMYKRLQ